MQLQSGASFHSGWRSCGLLDQVMFLLNFAPCLSQSTTASERAIHSKVYSLHGSILQQLNFVKKFVELMSSGKRRGTAIQLHPVGNDTWIASALLISGGSCPMKQLCCQLPIDLFHVQGRVDWHAAQASLHSSKASWLAAEDASLSPPIWSTAP